jgi:CRISPR-associated protein Cas1
MVAGKLQNARSVIMRASREAKDKTDRDILSKTAQIHAESIQNTETASDLDKLRGIEGYAAKAYFGSFTPMIRQNREAFTLTERTKNPPRDPINALLSFIKKRGRGGAIKPLPSRERRTGAKYLGGDTWTPPRQK